MTSHEYVNLNSYSDMTNRDAQGKPTTPAIVLLIIVPSFGDVPSKRPFATSPTQGRRYTTKVAFLAYATHTSKNYNRRRR